MTERVPLMPSPFKYIPCKKKVLPDPRTVRACDLTWFNTCGDNLVYSNYNTCDSKKVKTLYPFGRLNDPIQKPFNLIGNNSCDLFKNFRFKNKGCDKLNSNCLISPNMFSKDYIDPN